MEIKQVVQGFKTPEDSEKDHILGGVDYPVVLPLGNWTAYLPSEELQNRGFENYGCVTFTILNALEALAKVQFNEEWDLSERYTYIASETDPEDRGNDPRKVADSVRKLGTLAEKDLPFDELIDTLEKFNSPRPLTKELLKKGQEWLSDYVFRFYLLPKTNGVVSKDTLRDGLTRSPLLVALYAWAERDGKYFRPDGATDIHATLLVQEYAVFDSYAPTRKILEDNFPLTYAMGFFIRKKTEAEKQAELQNLSLFVRILQGIVNLYKSLIAKNEAINEVKPEVKESPVSRITDWARAISVYENANPAWNNAGAIRGLDGKFLRFKTYEEGFAYLCDYLTRACTGKHKAYPKGGEHTLLEFTKIYAPTADNNDPLRYCSFVANKLGVSNSIRIKELL